MNFLSRTATTLVKNTKLSRGSLLLCNHEVAQTVLPKDLTRSLVVLASSAQRRNIVQQNSPSSLCGCGCGIHGIHTKGDRELVEFLQSEIVAEKKNLTGGGRLPSSLGEFDVKASDAEVILTRTFQDEEIKISMNINHSVNPVSPVNEQGEQGESVENDEDLKSQPSFDVDIKVGSKTLSFSCNYTTESEMREGESSDVFGINEFTIYEGEYSEEAYCVSGDILDEILYDLFMNMLEERGISYDFVMSMSEMCTSFEHSQYINLLESVQSFVKRK